MSAGYPAVEDLIDSEDFDRVNETFERAYNELDKMSQSKGGLKSKNEVRSAMKAIENVMDLLRELLSIKYRLQSMGQGDEKTK